MLEILLKYSKVEIHIDYARDIMPEIYAVQISCITKFANTALSKLGVVMYRYCISNINAFEGILKMLNNNNNNSFLNNILYDF